MIDSLVETAVQILGSALIFALLIGIPLIGGAVFGVLVNGLLSIFGCKSVSPASEPAAAIWYEPRQTKSGFSAFSERATEIKRRAAGC